MARKNIFESVMRDEPAAEQASQPVENVSRRFGAAKSLSASIDELAKQAAQKLDGETIVELDPAQLDVSFVADRLPETDGEEYRELLEAIRERGQDSPILVRPHPETSGRYMIVFGHRRARVARELGIKVKAVIKPLADLEHILSQGQENSARANLSFIERVFFAARLEALGFEREAIQAALTVDYQTLSKMLTIPKAIPEHILLAIGPAKGIGRDRWLELRKLIEIPGKKDAAEELLVTSAFEKASSVDRFEQLYGYLKGGKQKKPVTKAALRPGTSWTASDKSVSAVIKQNGKSATLALSAANGPRFAEWLSRNLDELYASFRSEEK
ncbi:plasmid partitioning protein RepB [Brucella intermedia]|uniref:Plasmid partitioning protein RepB n=2 Tax=Alphaproteobacteria TaxID=28211 RepID=A0A7V6TZL5_9HYPH|nr:plasmid partitioning protein RepB [Brucella intermedia]PJR93172.1 plasmid partitioning protein RepB [Ochrobactrum sp. 721/2009]PJT15289.1 plasmid partitioning protein RepB [Ochrobactrum sp. 720/2009]PJT23244.1 plasmid partitioning protein RepB [Ochrobactrum sp. 715/2009]PJT29067.1 plasmid partitioning protein RepB [Ochrobactrum sp. 695/2009]PJT32573.1 plasmid partitioning protein RepB [Ochrobactrum sp. 689/2009]